MNNFKNGLKSLINKLELFISINNIKKWKIENFWILKAFEEKFNIRLNKLAKIKTKNDIILLNLIII